MSSPSGALTSVGMRKQLDSTPSLSTSPAAKTTVGGVGGCHTCSCTHGPAQVSSKRSGSSIWRLRSLLWKSSSTLPPFAGTVMSSPGAATAIGGEYLVLFSL